jgi:hypothetical protein
MPTLEKLAQHYEGEAMVVGVNQDREKQRARALLYQKKKQLSLPVALDDGSVGDAFRVSVIPHTVLLDRQGRVRHVHQGRVGYDRLASELDALLAE